MKIYCSPSKTALEQEDGFDTRILLYGLSRDDTIGSFGNGIISTLHAKKLLPSSRAFDLLSVALAVVAADNAVIRKKSYDGWTRQIDLKVAVTDVAFWNSAKGNLEETLKFLTTDIWKIDFVSSEYEYVAPESVEDPESDSVVLLSGGLDSLIGLIDLVQSGLSPYAVSSVAKGDKTKQVEFASTVGGDVNHIQFKRNIWLPIDHDSETSQRSRSFLFLCYGVLLATSLAKYKDGQEVTLYMCENGLISINPPLTTSHLGSHSTRTAHPHYLGLFQKLLGEAGLKVKIVNPYRFKTKGEMLAECSDQDYLIEHAYESASCGKSGRINQQCGRCLPCIIRRASFHKWGKDDTTDYKYAELTRNGNVVSGYRDVKSAAIAALRAEAEGVEMVIGANLASPYVDNLNEYKNVVRRGLEEVYQFLASEGVC